MMQTLRLSNGSTYNVLINKQTGNPVYFVDLGGRGYLYVEQHKNVTIQAQPDANDPDDYYICSATHLTDGSIAQTFDCTCLDDALSEMEQHYGDLLSGWKAPQTLNV
ncbi:hypothetical protein ACKFKG_33205 [Phormidesmis sp. 146-35]